MNCPRCQSTLESDSRFCNQCGATVQPYSRRIAVNPSPPGGVPTSTPAPAPSTDAAAAAIAAPRSSANTHVDDPAGEQLLWQGRPAWRAFHAEWAAWAIAGAISAYYVFTRSETGGFARNIWWLVMAAAAVGLLTRQLLIIFGVRYRLTSQRVFVDRGILSLITDQTELIHVDDVRIRRSLIQRICRVGTVEITARESDDDSITLESIETPDTVSEALRRSVQSIRMRKTLFVESV